MSSRHAAVVPYTVRIKSLTQWHLRIQIGKSNATV